MFFVLMTSRGNESFSDIVRVFLLWISEAFLSALLDFSCLFAPSNDPVLIYYQIKFLALT